MSAGNSHRGRNHLHALARRRDRLIQRMAEPEYRGDPRLAKRELDALEWAIRQLTRPAPPATGAELAARHGFAPHGLDPAAALGHARYHDGTDDGGTDDSGGGGVT